MNLLFCSLWRYLSLRLDGRVRGSGVGYPPWNAFVVQLPPVKGMWSGLLDGMDGRVLWKNHLIIQIYGGLPHTQHYNHHVLHLLLLMSFLFSGFPYYQFFFSILGGIRLIFKNSSHLLLRFTSLKQTEGDSSSKTL